MQTRLVCLTAAVVLLFVHQTRADDKPTFDKWEKEIAALEKRDQDAPPPKNAVLFVGSSSIRRWDVKKSFPDLDVINHGFGGSQIADSTHFAPRIVLKNEPRIVVFYAGDNDIKNGKTPEQVGEDFQAFAKLIHKELPKTKLIFISIKPSLARWDQFDKQKKANELIEAFCKKNDYLTYVDVVKPMLGDDGKPKKELFVTDGLHPSEKCYELWASLLKPLLI
jgi:lysophospholipase L1-like esterase